MVKTKKIINCKEAGSPYQFSIAEGSYLILLNYHFYGPLKTVEALKIRAPKRIILDCIVCDDDKKEDRPSTYERHFEEI